MPLVKNVGVNITINLLNEKRSRQYFYPFFSHFAFVMSFDLQNHSTNFTLSSVGYH